MLEPRAGLASHIVASWIVFEPSGNFNTLGLDNYGMRLNIV